MTNYKKTRNSEITSTKRPCTGIAAAVVAKWEGELLSEDDAIANAKQLDIELALALDPAHKD